MYFTKLAARLLNPTLAVYFTGSGDDPTAPQHGEPFDEWKKRTTHPEPEWSDDEGQELESKTESESEPGSEPPALPASESETKPVKTEAELKEEFINKKGVTKVPTPPDPDEPLGRPARRRERT